MIKKIVSSKKIDGINILHVTPEVNPILSTSNIASSVSAIITYLSNNNQNSRVFMPKFGVLSERKNKIHQITRLSGLNIKVGDSVCELLVKTTSLPNLKMQLYFIDGLEHFSSKEALFNCKNIHNSEEDIRAIFFCRGVLETLSNLAWNPDIIHCHGWFSAYIPILIKKLYLDNGIFGKTKFVISPCDANLNTNFKNSLPLKLGIIDKSLDSFLTGYTIKHLIDLAASFSDALVASEDCLQNFNTNSNTEKQILDTSHEGLDALFSLYKKLVESV